MPTFLTKRNLIIAAAVIAAAALAVYFGFLRRPASPAPPSAGEQFHSAQFPTPTTPSAGQARPDEVGELPEISSPLAGPAERMIQLSRDDVSSGAPLGTSSARYYKNIPENLGHLFERALDGSGE